MFHRHTWTDWLVTERGRIVNKYYQHHKLGSYLAQERYCTKCGKTQINHQRTIIYSSQMHVLVPEKTSSVPRHDKVN